MPDRFADGIRRRFLLVGRITAGESAVGLVANHGDNRDENADESIPGIQVILFAAGTGG
jgi:hypothetical protein